MIWASEDGDDYYATGHLTREEMISLIISYEHNTARAKVTYGDFHYSIRVTHYWVRWLSDERCEMVASGSIGSEKNTSFSPSLDWEVIEARGDAVERI